MYFFILYKSLHYGLQANTKAIVEKIPKKTQI